jgi:DNA-binding response OmpR family regulator
MLDGALSRESGINRGGTRIDKHSSAPRVDEWAMLRQFIETESKGRTMKRPMRFVVAAQQPLSAKVLSLVLGEAGHDVVVVPNATALVERVKVHETEAVLLSTDLPGFDEAEICRVLRASGYKGPVLVVAEQMSPPAVVALLDSGADEVMLLSVSPQEMMARVRAVIRRFAPQHAQVIGPSLRIGRATLSLLEMTVQVDGHMPILLTPIEHRILACLMSNSPLMVKREEIIEQAWGDDEVSETNELAVYIGRLRKKLEPDPRCPQYLHTVRGMGYIFEYRMQP